jgi:hypothetical protein
MFPRGIQHMKSIVSEPHFDPDMRLQLQVCVGFVWESACVCVCARVWANINQEGGRLVLPSRLLWTFLGLVLFCNLPEFSQLLSA